MLRCPIPQQDTLHALPKHERYLLRCLELAWTGWSTARPNPMVGSVVLDKNGRLAGEGFHQAPGLPHAEVMALRAAGEQAKDGTLYVNLEPCNHQGKTGPCSHAIVEAGLKKVIYASSDPNPVAQGGAAYLREAGLEVQQVSLAEAETLNELFLIAQRQQRPFVTLKLALTLDGKVAARNAHSQWITGAAARQWVHALRSGYPALLSTASSVLADNARLTVRDYPVPEGFSPPVRIILDRRLQLVAEKSQLALYEDLPQVPVWLICSEGAFVKQHVKVKQLQEQGLTVLPLQSDADGLRLASLWPLLWKRGVPWVLVEAGAALSNTLLKEGWVNKVYLIQNARTFNDQSALTPFQGEVCLHAAQNWRFAVHEVAHWGQDVAIEAAPLI